jgi:hypothetical protein
MKRSLLICLLAFAPHSSFAGCLLNENISATVYRLERNYECEARVGAMNERICRSFQKRVENSKISKLMQEYLRDSKGYEIVSSGGNFTLVSAENKNLKFNKTLFSLVFEPIQKTIWRKKFPYAGHPAEVFIAKRNQKILTEVESIKKQMSASTDPGELVTLEKRIRSVMANYDASLDTRTDLETSEELAIQSIPACNL